MASFRRSMLFIPGNNPGMIMNSTCFGADSIILDLEDAVALSEKDAARILVAAGIEALDFSESELIIRINAVSTPYWTADLDKVIPLAPDIIMPTKVQTSNDIRILDEYITAIEKAHQLPPGKISLIPLLETALGIENAYQIATSSKRIAALYLGAEDLTSDLKARRTKEGKEIFYSRSRIVIAARAAGLPALDTPFTDVDDEEGLKQDTILAKDLGFAGKAVISPRHVDMVNRIFTPSDEEITYAMQVLESIEKANREGKGAVSLNGKMIDAPIAERARQTMSMIKTLKGRNRR